MTVTLATTTITVLRVPDDPARDPYDPEPEPEQVVSGVRASISSPYGREDVAGGSREVVNFGLHADPCDLRHTDTVRDDRTGETFTVVWVKHRTGFGLDHVRAGLQHVSGVA
jgi:hypothetical protein